MNTASAVSTADYSQSTFDYSDFQVNDFFRQDTVLYDHQRLAIAWMLHREHEENRYCHVRGGMLMFSMGLGKTLCALGLVAKSKSLGPTLVIAPASIIYIWEAELKKRFENMSCIMYYGQNRKRIFEAHIVKYASPPDIVITSYQTVASDLAIVAANADMGIHIDPDERMQHCLLSIDWHRLILDECQYIKNNTCNAFRAVRLLRSNCQWLLSGTPVMNSINDMYSYLAILGYRKQGTRIRRPDQYTYTRNAFGRHFRDEFAYLELQELLTVIALRKTKDQVLRLPSKEYHDVVVSFNAIERQFYDLFKAYSRWRYRQLVVTLSHINDRLHFITHQERNRMRMIVLQQLLGLVFNLRMACCDPNMIIDKINRIAGLSISQAVAALQDFKYLPHCFACYLDSPTVVNTICGHALCCKCWKALERMTPMRCIICMTECSAADLTNTVSQDERSTTLNTNLQDEYEKRILTMSTKTSTVMDLVKEIVGNGEKVIVVSQWTSYLQILTNHFVGQFGSNVPFVTLTGKVAPKKRQKTLQSFQDDDNIKVCFASLTATAEGLNMTAASHVILADCFWNKAKMEQMSDRVHRIGQVRQVHVHSIFIADSIEIKLRQLVAQKNAICNVIVDGKDVQILKDDWISRIDNLTK